MNDIAIQVDDLGKRYRIGTKEARQDTLGATLATLVRRPIQNLRNLRQLTRFDDENRDDIVWALRNVSFEVKRGEVLGVIGHNGAGKSTLLKILSRITKPTSGRVRIAGQVSSLLEVGTGFHPELTGRENIYLNGTILGMRKAEIDKKFDEIVDFSGIERFIDTPVKRYSSGMQVRLAFSVAAHLEPEVLLIDEVLAVGDAAFQRKCLGKMENVARDGRTILFVSHNMGAISNMCHRSLLLNRGQIHKIGETQHVIDTYFRDIGENIQSGAVDLLDVPRNPILQDRDAHFKHVRFLKATGEPSEHFYERERVTVEFVVKVFRPVRNLQFGCTIRQINPALDLFTIPSPEYHGELGPGEYQMQLHIDPNPLRENPYSVALKLFADGLRQDTVVDASRFEVVKNLSLADSRAAYAIWVSGPMQFDFAWGDLETASPVQDLQNDYVQPH